MNYQEASAFLYSLKGLGMRLTLDRMERFCKLLGNPEKNFQAIHIAGTNGKGSTSAALASIFQAAGLRTGLYTSPHLIDLCERIQINRSPISHETLAITIERVLPAWKTMESEGAPPTFFELMTALAFQHFRDQKVDVAVIETGLGGRLDATNVLEKPEACVITSISFDHERILGHTLSKIAQEKAGIFKKGARLFAVQSQAEVENALEAKAKELGSIIQFVPPAKRASSDIQNKNGKMKQFFLCEGDNTTYTTSLLGPHQLQNLALAIHTARGLQDQFQLSTHTIERGIAEAHWAGRFDIISSNPWWIIDGAHNIDGLTHACNTWMEAIQAPPGRIIFGVLGDKNFQAMASRLDAWAPNFEIWLVPVDSERAIEPDRLQPFFKQNRPKIWNSVADALASQKADPHPQGTLLLGSLYLVGESLNWLKGEKAKTDT